VWIHLSETASSILGQQDEMGVERLPPVLLRVKVRAVDFLALIKQLAGVNLKIGRMILLLLPPVAEPTTIFVQTAV